MFARWTNLSETTFVLAPTTPRADYRVRIFTPTRELPFAGHPTLGTAHAWAERQPGAARIVQECEAGLIDVRRGAGRLAFAAPPLRREGPVDEARVAVIAAALRIERDAIRDARWAANGPEWIADLLEAGEWSRPDAVRRRAGIGDRAPRAR